MHHKISSFKSVHHQIKTIETAKITMSAFDNKRYPLNDGITSYAYNHYLSHTI